MPVYEDLPEPTVKKMSIPGLASILAVAKNIKWLRSLLGVDDVGVVEATRRATKDHIGVTDYPVARAMAGRLTTHPGVLEAVLRDTESWSRNTPADQKFRFMAGGAFTAQPGEMEWRESRDRLSAILSFRQNTELPNTILAAAEEFADAVEAQGRDAEFDIYPLAVQYAYRVISEIVLGKDKKDLASALQDAWKTINTVGGQWILEIKTPATQVPNELRMAVEKTNDIGQQALERETARVAGGGAKEETLINHLLHEGLSAEKVAAELRGALLAGHLTVTVAVVWLLSHLGNTPDFRSEVYNDLGKILQFSDLPLSRNHSERKTRMPHVVAAILEAFRVDPPAPIFGRGNKKKCPINVAGISMKPTDMVTAFIYGILRNSLIWPQAERFIPERLLGKLTVAQQKALAFIFGGMVSTRCPGEQLAWGELITLLWVLQKRGTVLDSPGPVEAETERITVTREPKGGKCPMRRAAA